MDMLYFFHKKVTQKADDLTDGNDFIRINDLDQDLSSMYTDKDGNVRIWTYTFVGILLGALSDSLF